MINDLLETKGPGSWHSLKRFSRGTILHCDGQWSAPNILLLEVFWISTPSSLTNVRCGLMKLYQELRIQATSRQNTSGLQLAKVYFFALVYQLLWIHRKSCCFHLKSMSRFVNMGRNRTTVSFLLLSRELFCPDD